MKQLFLILGDLVSYAFGLWLALGIRHLEIPSIELLQRHIGVFLIVFAIWLMTNYINGLYDLAQLRSTTTFYRRTLETMLMSFGLSILFFYILSNEQIAPKTVLVLSLGIGYVIGIIWRLLYNVLIGTKRFQTNVLFVGVTPEVREVTKIMQEKPEKGYAPVAIIDPENTIKQSDVNNISVYNSLRAIRPAVTNHDVKLVVMAPDIHKDEHALKELYELLFWSVTVTDLTSVYEVTTGRIPPFTFSESWFLHHLRGPDDPLYERFRVAIDYLSGVIIGLAFLFLFPFVALAIKINSPGPVFITQKRIGRFGVPFTMYKFRSMYALSPDGSAEVNGAQFAKKKDSRITAVGKILRKMRIDELPQCINLLKRDVTLIGPRPERPEIVGELESRMAYYSLRHVVRPGITGWAVLHQNYTDTFETSLQKLQYDLYYIKNRSFVLDLSILLRTVNLIVRLKGQ